jgi:hypothetical protein
MEMEKMVTDLQPGAIKDKLIQMKDFINAKGFYPANYLAIALLEQSGNSEPKNNEINQMEKLIKNKFGKFITDFQHLHKT